MDTKIFIVMHKNMCVPEIEGNYTLFVGAKGKKRIGSDYTDDTGDNISEKNPHYCELTGVYWIWKNVQADVVGVCHYRRFLTVSRYSNSSKYFLTSSKAAKMIENYDIILPKPIIFEKSVGEKLDVAPNVHDMEELRRAIEIVAPEYLVDYDWYMNQNKTTWFNIMVSRKSIFNSYCEWLFRVLETFESIHDMSVEDGYRERLQGMLSERLLNVWVHHNIAENKIKYLHWIKIGDSKAFLNEIKSIIKKTIWTVKKLSKNKLFWTQKKRKER